MEFEWDPSKAAANYEKHGITFGGAASVFARPHITERSDRGGDKRWLAIGRLEGRLITVVFTPRYSPGGAEAESAYALFQHDVHDKMKDSGITRKSLEEVVRKVESEGSDWDRVDALTDEEIKQAVAEDPDAELLSDDWFHRAKLVIPGGKEAA